MSRNFIILAVLLSIVLYFGLKPASMISETFVYKNLVWNSERSSSYSWSGCEDSPSNCDSSSTNLDYTDSKITFTGSTLRVSSVSNILSTKIPENLISMSFDISGSCSFGDTGSSCSLSIPLLSYSFSDYKSNRHSPVGFFGQHFEIKKIGNYFYRINGDNQVRLESFLGKDFVIQASLASDFSSNSMTYTIDNMEIVYSGSSTTPVYHSALNWFEKFINWFVSLFGGQPIFVPADMRVGSQNVANSPPSSSGDSGLSSGSVFQTGWIAPEHDWSSDNKGLYNIYVFFDDSGNLLKKIFVIWS
jgi:hypothetical protein